MRPLGSALINGGETLERGERARVCAEERDGRSCSARPPPGPQPEAPGLRVRRSHLKVKARGPRLCSPRGPGHLLPGLRPGGTLGAPDAEAQSPGTENFPPRGGSGRAREPLRQAVCLRRPSPGPFRGPRNGPFPAECSSDGRKHRGSHGRERVVPGSGKSPKLPAEAVKGSMKYYLQLEKNKICSRL